MIGQAAEALYAFFSAFGLRAYPQGDVPEAGEDEGTAPYIVYPIASPGFCETVDCPVQIYDRSESYVRAAAAADAIRAAVGTGVLLPFAQGALCLRPGEQGTSEPEQDRCLKCLRVDLLLTGYGL